MESRRKFLQKILVAGGMLALHTRSSAEASVHKKTEQACCTVFRSIHGTPSENLVKVVEMSGGIQTVIGPNDVVLIKPNVQWWNQGAPNLSALKTLVELVMDLRGGFRGEVIIAENCHRGQYPSASKSSGWARSFQLNSDLSGVSNMTDLSGFLKKKYGNRFSAVHWLDVSCGGKRVYGPAEGTGYVYCDGTGGVPLLSCDNGRSGPDHRTTIMTYPVFTTDKGTVVDFKHGVWEKGSYTNQPLRFINFSALNHHSTYCGVTSAVKNYMGITDLSGGPDPHNNGRLSADYYNFHSFPLDKWAPGPASGMLGKEIGVFMKTIRKADLNITTAEWVGLSSRTDLPAAHTRAVLASTDPVALDYHAAKYILYPNSRIPVHNPDDGARPLRQYLSECAEECGGHLDEGKVRVRSYDLARKRIQSDDELVQLGDIAWGAKVNPVMKYLYLRYFA